MRCHEFILYCLSQSMPAVIHTHDHAFSNFPPNRPPPDSTERRTDYAPRRLPSDYCTAASSSPPWFPSPPQASWALNHLRNNPIPKAFLQALKYDAHDGDALAVVRPLGNPQNVFLWGSGEWNLGPFKVWCQFFWDKSIKLAHIFHESCQMFRLPRLSLPEFCPYKATPLSVSVVHNALCAVSPIAYSTHSSQRFLFLLGLP